MVGEREAMYLFSDDALTKDTTRSAVQHAMEILC